jgi:hypothetical protein
VLVAGPDQLVAGDFVLDGAMRGCRFFESEVMKT